MMEDKKPTVSSETTLDDAQESAVPTDATEETTASNDAETPPSSDGEAADAIAKSTAEETTAGNDAETPPSSDDEAADAIAKPTADEGSVGTPSDESEKTIGLIDRNSKLTQNITSHLDVSLPNPISSRENLVEVYVLGQHHALSLKDEEKITFGRPDTANHFSPTIDLSTSEDTTFGISRRHAQIIQMDDHYYIEDLDSRNGTWLNEQALTPHVPSRLQSGDQIRISHLPIRVYFHRGETASEAESDVPDVLAVIAHEFRTPVSVLDNCLQLLLHYSGHLSAQQQQEKLQQMGQQINHINQLMEDVLFLSRFQKGETTSTTTGEAQNIQALCATSIKTVRERFNNAVPVHLTCEPPDLSCVINAKMFRHILQNLVSNAVKYSPANTPVDVSVSYADEALVLTVTDDGIGIPEAFQAQLFALFSRAENVDDIEGTGLGLSIVKEAVDFFDGRIICNSEVGDGTIFIVTLPIERVTF